MSIETSLTLSDGSEIKNCGITFEESIKAFKAGSEMHIKIKLPNRTIKKKVFVTGYSEINL